MDYPERPRRQPKRPPKYNPDKNGGIIEIGFFPIPIVLITVMQALFTVSTPFLTPLDVSYLLLLISRFNYVGWNKFSISDECISRILNASQRSIRRARKKFEVAGWLKTIQGRSGRGTQYLELNCPGFTEGKPTPPYLRVERNIFALLLGALKDGTIKPRHIMAYLSILYFEYQNREDRRKAQKGFTISKSEFQALFKMDNTTKLVMELSQITLTNGEPIFKAEDNYQNLKFTALKILEGSACINNRSELGRLPAKGR